MEDAKRILKRLLEEELEPQIGDIVKLRSGRIDKIIKKVKSFGGLIAYYTQELHPPAGQKPKIGKLYYEPDSSGVRDFEIISRSSKNSS